MKRSTPRLCCYQKREGKLWCGVINIWQRQAAMSEILSLVFWSPANIHSSLSHIHFQKFGRWNIICNLDFISLSERERLKKQTKKQTLFSYLVWYYHYRHHGFLCFVEVIKCDIYYRYSIMKTRRRVGVEIIHFFAWLYVFIWFILFFNFYCLVSW